MSKSDLKLLFITGSSRTDNTLLSVVLRADCQAFGLRGLHYYNELSDARNSAQKPDEIQMGVDEVEVFAGQQQGILAAQSSHEECTRTRVLASRTQRGSSPLWFFTAAIQQVGTRKA